MEAELTNPVGSGEPSQVAYTRLLHRLEATNDALLLEVNAEVCFTSGVLVLDDTVLDKQYARKMDLVHHLKETRIPAGTYAFDGCYSSLVNLKKIDAVGGRWLTRPKHNRRVNPDRTASGAVTTGSPPKRRAFRKQSGRLGRHLGLGFRRRLRKS